MANPVVYPAWDYTYPENPNQPPGATGNPFGTPVASLALEMAVRNQKLLEKLPSMTENQRRLINQRLTPYGGDLSQYESFMDVGYDPTAKAMQTTLEAQRDYLVGLPELLQKAMKEGEKSGVTYKAPPNTNPLQDYLNRIMNNIYSQYSPKTDVSAGRVSPDTAEARVRSGQPASPWRSTTRRGVTSRRIGGPSVSFR